MAEGEAVREAAEGASPLDRFKLGFKGFREKLVLPGGGATAANDCEAPGDKASSAMDQDLGSSTSSASSSGAGALWSSWTAKVNNFVAEKVNYDVVPQEASRAEDGPDEEKGEAPVWANWAKAAANRVGKSVTDAAEDARQNLEKVTEKAKTVEWGGQVTKGLGTVTDRAKEAREVFSERGKAAQQNFKDLSGKSAAKLGEAQTIAAQRAKDVKDKAAGVAGAAKGKLAQAGQSLGSLSALALSPAKLAQFGGVFFAGVFLISMSFSFLPMLPVAPQKFSLLFAMGSMTLLSSFAILKGPQAFLSGMARREQLPFSVCYAIGLVGTLVATLILRSFLLTAFFGLMQAVGLLYFVASYVPGGKAFVSFIGRMCSKGARSLLCRSVS